MLKTFFKCFQYCQFHEQNIKLIQIMAINILPILKNQVPQCSFAQLRLKQTELN